MWSPLHGSVPLAYTAVDFGFSLPASLACPCATSTAASPAQQTGRFRPDNLSFSQESQHSSRSSNSSANTSQGHLHLSEDTVPQMQHSGGLGENKLHALSSSRYQSSTHPRALSLVPREITPTDSQQLLYPWYPCLKTFLLPL